MHQVEQLGMKLVSCQVSDKTQVSPPIGALCYFLVPSWTLRPVNPANTSFWCQVCWTLQITLMYMELELISEPSLEVLELKKYAKTKIVRFSHLKNLAETCTPRTNNFFKGVKTRFSSKERPIHHWFSMDIRGFSHSCFFTLCRKLENNLWPTLGFTFVY